MAHPTRPRLAQLSRKVQANQRFEIGMAEPGKAAPTSRFAHGLACALPMEDTPGHCDT